jgi:hypothetical protein
LYRRQCDFSGATIISNYHPDSPYKVYKQDVWHSDKWDPLEYGKTIDWNRPFFEQYRELLLSVPRYSLHTSYEYDENCDYTNYCTKNKDCYLIFDSDVNRNCYYSFSANRSEDSMDSYRIGECRLCHECIDCVGCYNCTEAQDCENCSDSMFIKSCIGCRNCIMCANMVNKEYCVENTQVSKDEYAKIRTMLRSRTALNAARARLSVLRLNVPHRWMHGTHNEDVRGDYLSNCKMAWECFDSRDLWDCRYNFQGWMPVKDAMDTQQLGDAELGYECAFSGMESRGLWFVSHCFGNHDILYSGFCRFSSDLFGCVGLQRKKYCILNKQYSPEDYATLTAKLIEHMRKNREWGEYMPMQLASFAYNETIAQNYYPLTEEEAKKGGFAWRVTDPKEYASATFAVPETIENIADSVTGEVLACSDCKKNYRIIQKELEFLRSANLPLPDRCFFCRHERRRLLRNPRKLWNRECAKCKDPIATSYAPERPEAVYCEPCYLKAMY